MASPPYGYRRGERVEKRFLVDASTAAIVAGDFLVAGTAGYVQQAAAGELPVGVAMQSVASPSADGDVSCLVDISPHTEYEFPPDEGTVTQGLVGTTMDVGGPQSVNIDASADDILVCVGVDTVANTLRVQLIPTFAGVA